MRKRRDTPHFNRKREIQSSYNQSSKHCTESQKVEKNEMHKYVQSGWERRIYSHE